MYGWMRDKVIQENRLTLIRKPWPVILSLVISLSCDQVPRPINVVDINIAQIQENILSGQTTCRMIVQSYLDRIEAYDKSTINAITVTNPVALDKADAIDLLVQQGEQLGPLFCAPLLIKDNFDTEDLPTTAGSIALLNNYPPDDAFMVQKIREADGIVLAKTNMAEWAFSARQTVSSSYDTTANAYALDRVPAGSSGGTASGVAASLGVAGLGSDTGNSIRGPSSHLALVGIRSTIGLTSRDGVVPLSFDRDIAGPMANSVEDAARIFNVVAGYDPADPYTEAGRGRKESDYTNFLRTDGLEGARIAIIPNMVYTEDADTAVVRLFEQAVSDLEALGAQILDSLDFDLQKQLDRENMSCRRFRYDMYQYLSSLGDAAPIKDVLEVLESGQYSSYAENSLRSYQNRSMDIHPAQDEPPCPDYLDNQGRQAYLASLVSAMDADRIDAVIYPTWRNPPAHIDRGNEEYKGDNSQLVAPATGMPAITVPMGFTYGTLPAGLQLVARPYQEGLLFQYAYAYEQQTKHRRPPEGFPPL